MEVHITNKEKHVFIALLLISVFFITVNITVEAAPSEDTIKSVFNNFPELFSNNNIIKDTGRNLGWGCVSFFHFLAKNASELYENTLGIVDFTNSADITEQIFKKLQIIFPALMSLSIMGLGILLILKHEKKPDILISLFMIVLTVGAGNFLIVNLNHVADAAKEFAGSSTVDDVISENIYDLAYISNKNGGLSALANRDYQDVKKKNEFLAEQHYPQGTLDIDHINITEVLNYNTSLIMAEDDKGKDGILGKTIVSGYDVNGNYSPVLGNVSNGIGFNSEDDTDLLNTFYYRYKADFFPIILQYIAIGFIYICMSYKVIRLIIEIIFGHILAYIYSADITGTQKTIKCLTSILNAYLVLLLSAVALKVFNLGQGYLHDKFYAEHKFTFVVLLAFLAFSIADAPNIIQQITGIDAGLQPGMAKLMALGQASKTFANIFTTPYHAWQNYQNASYFHHMNQERKNQQRVENQNSVQTTPPDETIGGASGDNNVPPSSESENDSMDVSQNNGQMDEQLNNNMESSEMNETSNGDINGENNDSLEKNGLDGVGNEVPNQDSDNRENDMVDLTSDSTQKEDIATMMNNDWEKARNGNMMEDMSGVSGIKAETPADIDGDIWNTPLSSRDVTDASSYSSNGSKKSFSVESYDGDGFSKNVEEKQK